MTEALVGVNAEAWDARGPRRGEAAMRVGGARAVQLKGVRARDVREAWADYAQRAAPAAGGQVRIEVQHTQAEGPRRFGWGRLRRRDVQGGGASEAGALVAIGPPRNADRANRSWVIAAAGFPLKTIASPVCTGA